MSMIVPKSAHELVRLQRTDCRGDASEFYAKKMAIEYESIESALPAECDVVLDVGCGLGGIDVFLWKHYGRLHLFMLDSDVVSAVKLYGFRKEHRFYSSFKVTRELLDANGIDMEQVTLLLAPEGIRFVNDGSVDLVISLASWCFHYPAEQYVEEVKRVMKQGATLIIDVRGSVPDVMLKNFKLVKELRGLGKSKRIAMVKP